MNLVDRYVHTLHTSHAQQNDNSESLGGRGGGEVMLVSAQIMHECTR